MWKVILLSLMLSLSACDDMCGNTEAVRLKSPDGAYSAVLFERNCGATTGFSTQISVVGLAEKPRGKGNAFIADDNHGNASRGAWGGSWAEMKWLGPGQLLIRYDAKSRIAEQKDSVGDVAITYEAVNR